MIFKFSKVMELSDVAITIDIEWAPDALIENCLDMLNESKIKATFFATHDHETDLSRHEIAIHPNMLLNTWKEEVKKLIKSYPDAKGARFHSLWISAKIYEYLGDCGIEYSSNYYMYNQANICPFMSFNYIVEIPIFFMDNLHIIFHENSAKRDLFSISKLNLKSPGIKVFDFHPIHLYLNTENLGRYEKAKKYYHNPKKLIDFKNNGIGTKNLFIELLEYIKQNKIKTYTLEQIHEIERKRHSLFQG